MVYNTQNYWIFGLFPSSGTLENRKHDVPEIGSFSVLRLVGGRHLFISVPYKELTFLRDRTE
jgi:hypothetical protein